MIYIILCILVNTALILVFRLFPKFKIDSFQAIVANYFVAAFLGFQIAPQAFGLRFIMQQPWVFYAMILGMLFVSLFYLNYKDHKSRQLPIESGISTAEY